MSRNYAFSLMKRWKCQHKGTRLTKTWFGQPGRAIRRHNARILKAKKAFPRPINKLHPIVQCPTIRHNIFHREGRGFSLKELEAVKLNPLRARQLGIAVDYRRVNKTQQGLDANIKRLQEYVNRLVIFKKDAKPEEIKACVQPKTTLAIPKLKPVITVGKVSDAPQMDVYKTIHNLRKARLVDRKANAFKLKRAALKQQKK